MHDSSYLKGDKALKSSEQQLAQVKQSVPAGGGGVTADAITLTVGSDLRFLRSAGGSIEHGLERFELEARSTVGAVVIPHTCVKFAELCT